MLLVLKQWLHLFYFWLYFQAWTQKQKRVWSIILLIDSTSFKHNCVLYTWSLDTVTYLVSLFFMVLFCFWFCFLQKLPSEESYSLTNLYKVFFADKTKPYKCHFISLQLILILYLQKHKIKCGLFFFLNLDSTIKKYFSCLHGFTPTEMQHLITLCLSSYI